MEERNERVPQWMRGFLLLASIYNVAWGIFIYNFPTSYFRWLTKSSLEAPALISYQGLGTLIFGAIYLSAALYPLKLWFLIPLGIISKIAGAIGAYFIIMDQMITRTFLFQVIMNDLVWVIPFIIIYYEVMMVRRKRNISEI
ncbi:hypothetical protein BH23BAC1_BH23BAC1_00070 [soil metagenome]